MGFVSRSAKWWTIVACCLFFLYPPETLGQIECTISQYPNEVGASFGGPSLSLDSPWMAFSGNGVLARGGGFEVFLGNVDTGTMENLTNASGYDGNLTINADGTRIAFESQTNLTGMNPDGNREIVLLDRTMGEFTQLTDSTGFNNFEPMIAGSGTRVVFRTANDLVGKNPSNVQQIFLYDTGTGSLSQLTQLTSGPFGYGINSTASLLVFAADDDLTGDNPEGNYEIFLLDLDTNELTDSQTVEGLNRAPTISMNGERIAFFSDSEEFVWSNPDGLPEVVVHQRCNGGFMRLSNANPNFFGGFVSPDGNRVLASLNDVLVLYDVPVGANEMVVTTPGINSFSSSNPDGSLVGIRSDANLTGENPDRSFEIFLARCEGVSLFADGFECGDASAWSRSVGIMPGG